MQLAKPTSGPLPRCMNKLGFFGTVVAVVVVAAAAAWWHLDRPFRATPEQRARMILAHEIRLYAENPHLGSPVREKDHRGVNADQVQRAIAQCPAEEWTPLVPPPRQAPEWIYLECQAGDLRLFFEVYYPDGRRGHAASTMIACPSAACRPDLSIFPPWV